MQFVCKAFTADTSTARQDSTTKGKKGQTLKLLPAGASIDKYALCSPWLISLVASISGLSCCPNLLHGNFSPPARAVGSEAFPGLTPSAASPCTGSSTDFADAGLNGIARACPNHHEEQQPAAEVTRYGQSWAMQLSTQKC